MPPRTPGRTPGKTRDGHDKYIKYNANPRDVGTQSHRPMPTDVPLNDDGFEDPEQFMRSPSTSVTGSASRRTTMGGMSIAPSSVGTSRRVTKGRMSQLDASDDEDELAGGGGDDFDDPAADTTFFGNSHPTNVNLPRRSTLGPATPTTQYDDLPSPSTSKSASKRKSAAGTSRSGLRSPLTPLNNDHDDSMTLDSGGRASASPRKNKRARRSDTTEEDDEGDTSMDGHRQRADRQTRKSGLSALTDVEEDDDHDDFYDANQDVGGLEPDFGDDGMDEEDEADASLPAVEQQEEEDEEDEGDVSQGGSSGSGSGSGSGDSGEETAVERATHTKRIPASHKPGHKRRARVERRTDVEEAKSARLSNVHEVGEGKFQGDFTTRSGRIHMQPLRHWAGEKVTWGAGEYQAEVKAFVRRPIEEPRKLGVAGKKGRVGRGRVKSRTRTQTLSVQPDAEDVKDDGTGYDKGVTTYGHVLDYRTGEETDEANLKIIAAPYNQIKPKTVKSGEFDYVKVFGEDQFTAAGLIRIRPRMSKPAKSSKDNAFFFFVYKGGVNVKIHRTSFCMGPGAMFMVPRGNMYSIENVSEVDADIYFAQTRKHAPDEAEQARVERDAEADANKRKRNGTTVPREAEPQAEAEDATPPPPPKRKPGRPRKSIG